MIEEQLLYFGLPINIDNNATLHQPKLRDILQNDLSLEKILEPFITLDKQNFQSEKDNDNLKDFDIFFIQILTEYLDNIKNNKEIRTIEEWVEQEKNNINLVINRLINVLKFLFKTEDVKLEFSENLINLEENFIVINKSYKIDRNTYDSLKEMVCEIFDTQIIIEKKEKSEEENEMDKKFAERQKAYEKEYGTKKKDKNKDKLTIFTLVNYIIHNKFSQYNYNSVQELTIYQIKNTFKYYQSQETYDIDIRYRTSGNFKIEKNSDHWFFDK